MTRISSPLLDCYNKSVIKLIMDKYNMDQMTAARDFISSETHKMLENEEMAMWEFSDRAIFNMWEVERITGDPRNSENLRSE